MGKTVFGTLLSYIGPVDSAGMEGLLANRLKKAPPTASGGRTMMKRIGNVLIECLQNVMRHGLIEGDGFTQLYLSAGEHPGPDSRCNAATWWTQRCAST